MTNEPMQNLTLLEFSRICWHWPADLADWWVQVAGAQSATPLFEFRRGSLFIFENKTLPRMDWKKFVLMSLDRKLEFLAMSPVCVLTIETYDMFLVRLPQDFADDGGA